MAPIFHPYSQLLETRLRYLWEVTLCTTLKKTKLTESSLGCKANIRRDLRIGEAAQTQWLTFGTENIGPWPWVKRLPCSPALKISVKIVYVFDCKILYLFLSHDDKSRDGVFQDESFKAQTLPPSTTLQVSPSPSVLQELHQFRTAVTALEQSQTMLVKFGISLAIYVLQAK